MTITLVTTLYGDAGHIDYLPRWLDAVAAVRDPSPDRVIIGADRHLDAPATDVVITTCQWRHPHAWHLNQAIQQANTDWVWVSDVDDTPFPDALAGIDDVTADVWQMGYDMGDFVYIVPDYTPDEYLARPTNQFCGTSAFRLDAFNQVGGYDDIGFHDWGLWRKMCRAGMTIKSSGRAHFDYRPPHTRSAQEFHPAARSRYLAELREIEAA